MNESVSNKQLIKLNEKFLTIAKTVNTFRNNLKALKICQKLINFEIKEIKKSKQPLDNEKTNRILWSYIDLSNTIKFLCRTKNIFEINKGCADIENMISATEMQIAELKGIAALGNISATSQKIVSSIGETAQKIGDAVSEKIDGLKKMFVAEKGSKSE